MGVPEAEGNDSEKSTVVDILKTRLNISNPNLKEVYRLGVAGGKNPRPILFTFHSLKQRKAVWYNKTSINKDQEQKLWIQEDLPRDLRSEINALLKVYTEGGKAHPQSSGCPNDRLRD